MDQEHNRRFPGACNVEWPPFRGQRMSMEDVEKIVQALKANVGRMA